MQRQPLLGMGQQEGSLIVVQSPLLILGIMSVEYFLLLIAGQFISMGEEQLLKLQT
jgi:hypothetical protein